MTQTATPLQYGDPPRLGPFAVHARLHATPAGLVYLGLGPDGQQVSLALLTTGAAFDAAARERFVAAVREAADEWQGLRGWMAKARGRSAAPVLAMETGAAPWVAVAYAPGRPGAEQFLDSVLVGGTLLGETHGPEFVPYWQGDRLPALPPPPRPAPPPTETRTRVLIAAIVLGLLIMTGLVIGLLLLFSGDDRAPVPRPLPPTVFEPSAPPVPVSPGEPGTPSPSPGGSDGPSGPSPGDGPGDGNPI